MKIAVVGTGYVGLVAGCGFAEMGIEVWCVDIDEKKIAGLQQAQMPIYEPGLEPLLQRGLKEERLHFTTNLALATEQADIIFIAVGTPPDEVGAADLSHVLAVAREVGRTMNEPKVIVVKSTVPVGTCDRVAEVLGQETAHEYDIVSNPEFLKEGSAVDDFMYPDRIVVGANSLRARELMTALYEPFVRTGRPVVFTDVRSSEMIKYAANAMLATRISFMNEIANLCERVGADVNAVRKGIGADPRIGSRFLFPGVGYGGSCFPKDVKALIETAREAGYEMRVLQSVETVNERQKRLLVDKMLDHYGGDLAGRVIAVWGLAFKPKTDDMREAPSRVVVDLLLRHGAHVQAFDPVAMDAARDIFPPEVVLTETNYEALEGADALAIVTEWNEFRTPDFTRMKRQMKGAVIFDGRNLYSPKKVRDEGFTYYAVGRP